jgi:hypothetical protein
VAILQHASSPSDRSLRTEETQTPSRAAETIPPGIRWRRGTPARYRTRKARQATARRLNNLLAGRAVRNSLPISSAPTDEVSASPTSRDQSDGTSQTIAGEPLGPASDAWGTNGAPYSRIPEWILYRHGLSHGAVRLYGALARHADKNGRCWPSKGRLAGLLGVSKSSVDRWAAELESIGAAHVTQRTTAHGGNTSNLYTLAWVTPAPPPQPPGVVTEHPSGSAMASPRVAGDPAPPSPLTCERQTSERHQGNQDQDERVPPYPPEGGEGVASRSIVRGLPRGSVAHEVATRAVEDGVASEDLLDGLEPDGAGSDLDQWDELFDEAEENQGADRAEVAGGHSPALDDHDDLLAAMAKVLGADVSHMLRPQARGLRRVAKDLTASGATVEQVTEFGRMWPYHMPPTLASFGKHWATFLGGGWTNRGARQLEAEVGDDAPSPFMTSHEFLALRNAAHTTEPPAMGTAH